MRIWSIFYSSQLKTESIGPTLVLRNNTDRLRFPPQKDIKKQPGLVFGTLTLFVTTPHTRLALMQIFHPV